MFPVVKSSSRDEGANCENEIAQENEVSTHSPSDGASEPRERSATECAGRPSDYQSSLHVVTQVEMNKSSSDSLLEESPASVSVPEVNVTGYDTSRVDVTLADLRTALEAVAISMIGKDDSVLETVAFEILNTVNQHSHIEEVWTNPAMVCVKAMPGARSVDVETRGITSGILGAALEAAALSLLARSSLATVDGNPLAREQTAALVCMILKILQSSRSTRIKRIVSPETASKLEAVGAKTSSASFGSESTLELSYELRSAGFSSPDRFQLFSPETLGLRQFGGTASGRFPPESSSDLVASISIHALADSSSSLNLPSEESSGEVVVEQRPAAEESPATVPGTERNGIELRTEESRAESTDKKPPRVPTSVGVGLRRPTVEAKRPVEKPNTSDGTSRHETVVGVQAIARTAPLHATDQNKSVNKKPHLALDPSDSLRRSKRSAQAHVARSSDEGNANKAKTASTSRRKRGKTQSPKRAALAPKQGGKSPKCEARKKSSSAQRSHEKPSEYGDMRRQESWMRRFFEQAMCCAKDASDT